MIRITLITLASFALAAQLAAQDPDQRKLFQPYSTDLARATDTPKVDTARALTNVRDGVTIHEDPRITRLMDDFTSRKQVIKGYRVQVFLGTDRKQGEELRRAFLLKHPDVPAYLSYLAPNFRVRVGDLHDRFEAEKLRSELKAEFPGLYIVPDEIEMMRVE